MTSRSLTVTVQAQQGEQPVVESITVNGGDAQRSSVEALTIRFSHDVTFDDLAQAVQVFTQAGDPVALDLSCYSYDAASRTLTINLRETGSLYTMLADGRYELRLDTARIAAAGAPSPTPTALRTASTASRSISSSPTSTATPAWTRTTTPSSASTTTRSRATTATTTSTTWTATA